MRAEEKKEIKRTHTVGMTDRGMLALTGVSDVDSFNEQMVVLTTSQWELTVLGQGLHVSALDLEAGKLNLDGRIDVLEYADNRQSGKRGFWRVFK